MFETLISDPSCLLWAPVPHIEKLPIAARFRRAVPIIQPGQLWLIELPATEPELSPLEYQALATANVVIYDRALAPTVARLLPLGGYAEPAPPGDWASDAALERCLGFARDGWSVARLVDPRSSPRRRLARQLPACEIPAQPPAMVFINAGGGEYYKSEAQLDQLGEMIDAQSSGPSRTLTIIFGRIGSGAAPRFSVASTNGLAG